MTTSIPYVQSAASQEVPPPYHFPGVTVHAFVCEVVIPQLEAYCDKFFNLGDPAARGFRYGPAAAWPYALLMFIDYPVMISSGRGQENIGKEPQYSNRGVVSQKEVFITAPVMRIGTAPGTLLTHSAIEWAIPFITVGNPMSAVCGREMVGLEKLRGEIEFGEGYFPDSFRGRVSLPGWTLKDPDRMQRMLPFLEVETGPVIPTFRGPPRASSLYTLFRTRTATGAMAALATAANLLDSATAGAIPTTMQTVALKQFRDALRPDLAVYQALTACRTKYSNIAGIRFFKENDVRIRFDPQGSFGEITQFLQTSSLQEGPLPKHVIQPVAAYRFNADIDFDNMHTLYSFPIDGGDHRPPTPASSHLTAPWLRPWKGFFGPRKSP